MDRYRDTTGGGPHAVVLAGGKGVRLRPYTTCLPKPLVPLGDECAILELVMRQLALRGFGSVTLAIGHLGHLIRAFVGDGSQWGLAVDYWDEESPLGTIGPLVQHRDELPDHFLVMNGDILCDVDFGDVLRSHQDQQAELTVAAYQRKVHIDFGVLDLEAGRIAAFREKPSLSYAVSMGIYGMSRGLLERYTPGLPLGFDELVLDLLDEGRLPHTYDFDGYWLDIGRPEDYDQANRDFPTMRAALLG